MISEESRKRRKRLEEKKEEEERAEIEIPTNILRKTAFLRNSGFTETTKGNLTILADERAQEITTTVLLKIISKNKHIFSGDRAFALSLINLLVKRSGEQHRDIHEILFWASCMSSYGEVKKQAAASLEKLATEQEIVELARKFLA